MDCGTFCCVVTSFIVHIIGQLILRIHIFGINGGAFGTVIHNILWTIAVLLIYFWEGLVFIVTGTGVAPSNNDKVTRVLSILAIAVMIINISLMMCFKGTLENWLGSFAFLASGVFSLFVSRKGD